MSRNQILVKVARIENDRPPFTVYGETVEERPKPVKVSTWNSLKASACRQAKETHRYVWMTWRDRHFGLCDLVSVELDTTKFTHDEPCAS